MEQHAMWVGMDVHKKSISVAIVLGNEEVPERFVVPNDTRGVRRLVRRLKAHRGPVRCCYEAGPCGFVLQRTLQKAGISCAVIAPTLIPVQTGCRVKTDRRDALKLAKLLRAELLTEVHLPTEAEEAVRDLCRCREDAKQDQTRARHRLQKFLLRRGVVYNNGKRSWTGCYYQWLRQLRFEDRNAQRVFDDYLAVVEQQDARLAALDDELEHVAGTPPYREPVGWLRCFRGIDTITAMGLLSELGDIERFDSARGLMAYVGQVPSEQSSGERTRRGGITKTGNRRLRRLLTESSQHCRLRPAVKGNLRKRRMGQPTWAIAIADKAQRRLHQRYWHLVMKGKPHNVAITAVGREFVGFVWELLVEGRRRATPGGCQPAENLCRH